MPEWTTEQVCIRAIVAIDELLADLYGKLAHDPPEWAANEMKRAVPILKERYAEMRGLIEHGEDA